MMFLHSVPFSMSFSLSPTPSVSSFTTSRNLLFGLPLFLFPVNSISVNLLPTYSWSLLMTCPYHISLLFLIFIPNRSTLTVTVMYSFQILTFLVTPIANLNNFISATSISFTCFFVTATVSSRVTESESESVGGFRKESESDKIFHSDSDSSCPISLHISDVNRATYAAACASGVLCSNLFKRTLPRIARHSPRLIKIFILICKQIVFCVMPCSGSRFSFFSFFNRMTGSKCQVHNQLLP